MSERRHLARATVSRYLVYEGDCPRCGDRLGEADDEGARWCVCGTGVAAARWGFEPLGPENVSGVIFGPDEAEIDCDRRRQEVNDIVARLHTAAEQTRTSYHPSVADSLAAIYTDAADRIEALITAGLAVADRWDADEFVRNGLMDDDIGRLRAAIEGGKK